MQRESANEREKTWASNKKRQARRKRERERERERERAFRGRKVVVAAENEGKMKCQVYGVEYPLPCALPADMSHRFDFHRYIRPRNSVDISNPSIVLPASRYATFARSRWATSEPKSSPKGSRVRASPRNTNLHLISTQGMLRLIRQLILPSRMDDSRKLNRAARCSDRMSEIVSLG